MTHFLKCIQPYFDRVASGDKTFEVRKDDRCFQTGDVLCLQEVELDEKGETKRLGQSFDVDVTFVLHGFQGIEPGYVVMGIKPRSKEPGP